MEVRGTEREHEPSEQNELWWLVGEGRGSILL